MSKCLYGFDFTVQYCGTVKYLYGEVSKFNDDRCKGLKVKKKHKQDITLFAQRISVLLQFVEVLKVIRRYTLPS